MTDLEILIDTDSARLVYHTGAKIVHHEFRRFVFGPALRAVLEQGAQLMEERRASKWLSDDRGNGPLKPADSDWCMTVWFPRARAAGWKHWAVVMPESVLGQMNMRRWIEHYEQAGINAHPFSDPLSAMTWLEIQG